MYVVDPFVEEDGHFRKVIQNITYSLGSSGSTVSLSLCGELKFQLFAEPDAKKIKIEDNNDIKKNSGRIV